MADHTLEGAETPDAGGQDSSVIQALRKQLKDAQEKARLADEMRAQAAEAVLTDLGFPKLKDLYLERVQEVPTRESAANFLEGLGLAATSPDADTAPEPEKPAPSPAGDMAKLSNLGQRVASAAEGGGGAPDMAAALAEAQNAAEVQAIMEQFGATITI